MKKFEYFNPSSLKEASELMVKNGEGAHILNGGTDLITQMHDRLTFPDVIIDIKDIKELYGIRYDEGKGLTIGACVTLNELGEDRVVIEKYPFLAKAALSVGSRQVRNRATCVGNLCNASPLADTATPLLALDAEINIYGPDGIKTVSVHDFFVFVRKTCLKPEEVVQSIFIPELPAEAKGVFQKISRRKEVDLSTVCATVLRAGSSYRIAYGAVAPTPVRVRKAEAFLEGKELTEKIVEEAMSIARGEVSPIDDIRASKEYRLDMVGILLKNGINVLAE